MTNYFLSPLGSRRWLPSNVMGSGGTHPAMLTSLGQQLIGDEISAISAAAAAAHDQSVARKSYLNYYRHQGAVARDNNTSDFLVYQDPLAALASGKYASSNLPQTTVAAAAAAAATTTTTSTSTTSFSSSPPACCNNNSPTASSSVAAVVNDFAAGGESSPGDYLMRSVDSLVAATSPQIHDDAFLNFLKAHEDKLNAAADQESPSVTVINNNSCSFLNGGAQGFDKLCGDHHHGEILTCDSRVQQHPGLIQAPTAAAPAAHVVDDAGMTTAFQHAIMQEEPMKVVQLGAQNSLESSSSLAHNSLDSIEDAPSGMSLLWPHEEQQQQQCEEDEGLLRLLREAAGEAEGRGFFEDEVADVGDGQARNMQQSSGQSLHSSSSHQYFSSTSSVHSRVAFPEAVAMGSPPPNQVLWLPSTGAKSSVAAQGLRRVHDDDTPAAAAAAPPLQQPPKVQTLAAAKQLRGGSSSSSCRSPGTSAETRRGSERHETLKWLGAPEAAGSSYRNPDAVVAGTLQMMKPLAGRDRSQHHELCAALGTSKPCAVQSKAANSSNSASTSSPPSSSSASFVAQSPLENQGSSRKPLNEAQAAPQAENNQAQKRKRYSEINGLIELMSTEHKPYLEIAALDTTTTINPVPSSRALHNMEDALKIAVSNTLARKRFRSAAAAGPHANHQQHDSKEYWQPSKKQEVMRKPISPSARQHANHQQQHDSKDSRAYQSSNSQQVMRKPISPSATVHELECQTGVPERTPPAAELEGNSSRVPEQITPAAAELECHSRVPQEIITPAATALECHSRVPQEITPPAAAELECHSRVPEETTPAAAELECHSGMREITTPAAAEDSWISNESAVKVAMPQVVVVNVEDSMGVEYWENLLAAGFAGEYDDCTPCQNDDDDDDFPNVELDTRPQSPLSDFTSGMAMLFDYL
ncbi:hypothetical protein CY35_08G029900 [Sphagnum magellanicum]|nr:hypothetical protein CY35_08G029900 [Sphagnum magellanicum]